MIRLIKLAKRGDDKVLGEYSESTASRGSINNNDMQTRVRLFFTDDTDGSTRYIVEGDVRDMRELVCNIAFNAVTWDRYDNKDTRYSLGYRKPDTAAWLRSIADQIDSKPVQPLAAYVSPEDATRDRGEFLSLVADRIKDDLSAAKEE